MAEKNIGKITQIISAVLDIKFAGKLPEINEAIEIIKKENLAVSEAELMAKIKSMADKYKKEVCEYYKTEDLTLEGIATSRNWIITGGNPDTERTAVYLLRDFREGKIGKFILDDISEFI